MSENVCIVVMVAQSRKKRIRYERYNRSKSSSYSRSNHAQDSLGISSLLRVRHPRLVLSFLCSCFNQKLFNRKIWGNEWYNLSQNVGVSMR